MVRVKRGKAARKRRKNLLKHAKGFRWGRKSKYKAAKQALMKAWSYAYRDRKVKKRKFRNLWIARINAGCRQSGIKYSEFIAGLKKAGVALDRKSLAELAVNSKSAFKKLVSTAKEAAK